MAKIEFSDFDVAEYLDSPEMIAEYLSQIIADGDSRELQEAETIVKKRNGDYKEMKRVKNEDC